MWRNVVVLGMICGCGIEYGEGGYDKVRFWEESRS